MVLRQTCVFLAGGVDQHEGQVRRYAGDALSRALRVGQVEDNRRVGRLVAGCTGGGVDERCVAVCHDTITWHETKTAKQRPSSNIQIYKTVTYSLQRQTERQTNTQAERSGAIKTRLSLVSNSIFSQSQTPAGSFKFIYNHAFTVADLYHLLTIFYFRASVPKRNPGFKPTISRLLAC